MTIINFWGEMTAEYDYSVKICYMKAFILYAATFLYETFYFLAIHCYQGTHHMINRITTRQAKTHTKFKSFI